MAYISAEAYTSLDRSNHISFYNVRRELDRFSEAQPTQIKPEERTAMLEAIFDDLHPGGAWRDWPEHIHIAALNTLKVLGRNPVGSGEVLLKNENFTTLVYHTALPFPGRGRSTVSPVSKPALEALRGLANTLVLHPSARTKLAKMGGGEAIARTLVDEMQIDRLFLLCRVGFLVTADGSGIRPMVDKESAIPRLVYHLHSIRPSPANYDALSELLKLVGNVLRYYPTKEPDQTDGWDTKLNPLLYPILSIVHSIPLNDLIAPLTHALHALLYIPFTSELLPMWTSVPMSILEDARKRNGKGGFFGRSKGRGDISPGLSRPASYDNLGSGSLSPPNGSSRSTSPTPSDDGRASPLARATDVTAFPRRVFKLLSGFVRDRLPGTSEPDSGLMLDEILPPILLLAAHAAAGSKETRSYFHSALFPIELDRSPMSGPLEQREGLLGTLLRFMNGYSHLQCRDTAGEFLWAVCGNDASVLCDEVGYGNASGLLFRKGITAPPPARVTELDESSSPTRSESGTAPLNIPSSRRAAPTGRLPSPGNARLSSPTKTPPMGSVPKMPPPSIPPPRIPSPIRVPSVTHPAPAKAGKGRHPITSLEAQADDGWSPFAGMTEDEKDREAEKMFALFDRLDRNPILSTAVPAPVKEPRLRGAPPPATAPPPAPVPAPVAATVPKSPVVPAPAPPPATALPPVPTPSPPTTAPPSSAPPPRSPVPTSAPPPVPPPAAAPPPVPSAAPTTPTLPSAAPTATAALQPPPAGPLPAPPPPPGPTLMAKPLREILAEKFQSAEMDAWEQRNNEQERLDAEREADELEAEAMRELAAYHSRSSMRR